MTELVLCAAVKLGPVLVAGVSHTDCYEFMSQSGLSSQLHGVPDEGFITSFDRFVNRAEAGGIAYAANQTCILWGCLSSSAFISMLHIYLMPGMQKEKALRLACASLLG